MRILATAIAAAMLAAPAWAHHGWDSYDTAKQTKLTVKIEKAAIGNPHAEIWAQHDGKPAYIILSPPGRMFDRGLKAEMLPVGKTVTVEVQPSTVNVGEWKAINIVVDGKNYNLMR
jgi:hypothetical protein